MCFDFLKRLIATVHSQEDQPDFGGTGKRHHLFKGRIMDDPIQNELRKLLGHLSTGLTEPERWQDWQIEPIFGGANNLLFRATGEPGDFAIKFTIRDRSEEHTSELQSLRHLVCRLLLEKT